MKYFILILSLFILSCQDNSNTVAWEDSVMDDEIELLADTDGFNTLEYLVIHCTATTPSNRWNSMDLLNFFKEEKGWSRPGYAFYITYDGTIHPLWDVTIDKKLQYSEVTYGAKGYNHKSLHIAYQGGSDRYLNPRDTRTDAQKIAIQSIVTLIKNDVPNIKIVGHNQLPGVTKACPSFTVDL